MGFGRPSGASTARLSSGAPGPTPEPTVTAPFRCTVQTAPPTVTSRDRTGQAEPAGLRTGRWDPSRGDPDSPRFAGGGAPPGESRRAGAGVAVCASLPEPATGGARLGTARTEAGRAGSGDVAAESPRAFRPRVGWEVTGPHHPQGGSGPPGWHPSETGSQPGG